MAKNQVFEVTDSFSIPVTQTAGNTLKSGMPYLVNAVVPLAGVLETDIGGADSAEVVIVPDPISETNPMQATYGIVKRMTNPGFNKPGYATVRVRGGAYRLPVAAVVEGTNVGDPVYIANDHTLTVTKGTNTVIFGWLYSKENKNGYVVVLDVKKA